MAAAATKFNGKVSVTIDSEGQAVCTATATEGLIGQLTDSITTVLSTQEVAVGNAALLQRLLLVVGGNVLATHSAEGKLGVSAFGKSFTIGS